MPSFTPQPTPNPNSLKITVDGAPLIDTGMESFNSAGEADAHPLGRRLFAIPGVVNVFIVPQFLTITKHPAANWDDVYAKVESTLHSYYDERG